MTHQTNTEVLPPESPLEAAKSALILHRDFIVKKEEKFQQVTLLPRVLMGLAALKAYMVFAVKPDARKGIGGRGKKNSVTRDTVSFEDWLEKEIPWFKRPTAYKYMAAVRGLGGDHDSTEQEIETLLGMQDHPTLKSLCDACADPVQPKIPGPQHTQTEFDFAKQVLCEYRVQSESILSIKDSLSEDMRRAASARAYNTLKELTGCDWAPSDIPDALADVDPDSISLS